MHCLGAGVSVPHYIPFFGADYLKDTQLLSIEEHGAYFLLMLTCWQQDTCSLPDDDKKLARICRVGIRKWKQIRETMEDYWTIENGRWTNERLTKERKVAEEKSAQARANAKARWEKQDTENKGSGQSGRISERNQSASPPAEQPQPQGEEPNGPSPNLAPNGACASRDARQLT